jgi:hypothetical protein
MLDEDIHSWIDISMQWRSTFLNHGGQFDEQIRGVGRTGITKERPFRLLAACRRQWRRRVLSFRIEIAGIQIPALYHRTERRPAGFGVIKLAADQPLCAMQLQQ